MIYANPQDLPSFPSLGLKKDDAAAGAAASLGWANARSLPLWTPEKDASAQRAATLANDYKMPALPQPARNPTGSKTAAVLAAENANHRGSAPDSNKHASMPASVWGNSAANQAFASAGAASALEPREPMTELNRQKSLRAAKGAFAGDATAAGRRGRSASSPWTYPDSANAAANALSAATIAHRPTSSTTIINLKMSDVGAQPVTSMGSEMYTSHPPVKPEVDEKNHDEALHASAVAMAKSIYAFQQQKSATGAAAAAAAKGTTQQRPWTADTDAPAAQPMQFTNLQEAAYKLAQERLARLHDEHQRNRGLADYYGTSATSPTSPGRRLTRSMGSKLRRRASSDGDVVAAASLGGASDDDRQRSRQIRKQMSLFSTRLDEVDESKRARDREALLAAAQRNVKATLEGMDEKMYREQGRVPPAKLNEWEAKAHVAAQARSEARIAGGKSGKVDLGAGQYMDQDEVNEIAARRVQPVLDEINEKAELERQRIVAQREEQEKKRLEWEAEKAKNREAKEDARRVKGKCLVLSRLNTSNSQLITAFITEEEKLRKEELKEEAKARKEEEKAAKAEEKRLAKEEKNKNKGTIVPSTSNTEPIPDASEPITEGTPQPKHRLSRPFTPRILTQSTWPATKQDTTAEILLSPEASPESPTEPHSNRVKNWLTKLRRRAKSTSANNNTTTTPSKQSDDRAPGAFIGGHALTRLHADGTGSLSSLSESDHRSTSMRDVALAGRRPVSVGQQAARDEEEVESSGGNNSKRHGRVLSNMDHNGRGGGDTVSSVASINSSLGQQGGGHGEAGGPPALARPHVPAALDLDFSTSSVAATPLEPPPGIADPAAPLLRVGTPRSVGSGHSNRDSRFVENID